MIKKKEIIFHKQIIRLMKSMALSDYKQLQLNAFAVLFNLGNVSEETGFLNFRALNTTEAHEHLEEKEEAGMMVVGNESRAGVF